MYARLGRWCFLNRAKVVIAWIVVLLGTNIAGAAVGSAFNGEFNIPASESADGLAVIEENFGGLGSSAGGSIVFQSADGVDTAGVRDAMEAAFAEISTIEGLSVVSPFQEFGAAQVSADRTVAFAQLNLAPDIDEAESAAMTETILEALPSIDGLRIEIGGAVFAEFEPPQTELIGLAFAIVVLIIAFGSVLAMGLPLGVALAGVVTGSVGLVTLLTNVVAMPDFAPIIGIMIGLGVGIDYALFIVTRYRELTRAGESFEDATAGAMDTAGRAVVFAGITVVMSLLGMLLMGLPFVAGIGIAAATTVFVTMVASITLLPALLGFAQHRVEVTRWRGLIAAGFAALALLGLGLNVGVLAAGGALLAGATVVASFFFAPLRASVPDRVEKPLRETLSFRWSRTIQKRPWAFLVLGGGALVLLSLPVFGLRLGFSDEGNFAEETTTRQAYDLIAEGFGPGFNGPLLLAVEVDDPADAPLVQALVAAVGADEGIAAVGQPLPSDRANPTGSRAYLVQLIPTTSPQDKATSDTVSRLRSDVVPSVVEGSSLTASLAGAVPVNIDFTSFISRRIFVFFGAVLAVSFLILMVVFRSLLVPLKAVLMNMLSISAAYGVVVAIFQWGWFGGISGVEPAPIEPFVPMMLFAIVFGLSMDYEVFLLSRVKEEFDRTGDPVQSVADGLAASARVITAAAAIMVVVFGSFLLEDNRIIKLFGVGLSVAVLLDATLVRLLLVPATMELLGEKNWWLPRWLDRLLPNVSIDGSATPSRSEEPEREPAQVG